jgi:hypothetical protein
MTGKRMPPPLSHEARSEEQEDLDTRNRRLILLRLLHSSRKQVHPAADLVLLADALGIDEELTELASRSERHQQILTDVRAELEQLSGRSEAQPGE